MTTETSIYEYAKQGLSYGADRTAIWFYGHSISYGELFEKIDNVADHLYARGVREGTVVTIHLPNCPQAVMTIYAVAKLGGICNMVHPLTPEAALRENMAFSKSEYLITHLDYAIEKRTVHNGHKVISTDIAAFMGPFYKCCFRIKHGKVHTEQAFDKLEKKCCKKAIVPKPESLVGKCAVYFHSSGTTGEPKTVMHSHGAINRSVGNAVDYYKLRSRLDEVVLSVLPLFHGMGFAHVMHISLSGGAELLQMAEWNIGLAAHLVDRFRSTLIVGVPRMFKALLGYHSFLGTSLRHCFVAGDNVSKELKEAFNAHVGKDHCIYEAYGLTEAVVGVCSCSAEHDNLDSCGFPVTNSELRVLDHTGELRKTGTGQLVVHINTLMLGYLNDPEASEGAFLESEGKRWLKTGDIGKIDDEGYVYFIDREKNVIVYNGYNIFPLEIERISRKAPGVEDVCVIGEVEKEQTRIVAYIQRSAEVSEETIKTEVTEIWLKYLPRYAIPQSIVFVSEFPRNLMGKVIREEVKRATNSSLGN